MPTVDLGALCHDPGRYLRPPCVLVVLGGSYCWTPSNRVRLGRVLHNPRPGVRRVVVDDRLYAVDPWRLWWPLKVVDATSAWEYTDSYRAESRWRAALDRSLPDPFRWEIVGPALQGVVRGHDVPRLPVPDVEIVPVRAETAAAYAQEKEAAFRDETSLPAIMRRLTAIAQAAVPSRAVPTAARFFARPVTVVRCTDLPVDRFLVDQLLARVTLSNRIAAFAETQS